MEDIKAVSNENLIGKILKIVEEKPYCSFSAIDLENYNNDSILAQLKVALNEYLILAEPAVDEAGDIINLFNIHLTLKGLLYLRKLNSIIADS